MGGVLRADLTSQQGEYMLPWFDWDGNVGLITAITQLFVHLLSQKKFVNYMSK